MRGNNFRKRETDNIGHKVELEKACEADFASPEVEDAGHEAQANVGGDDAVTFVSFENGRRRLEVLFRKMRERIFKGRHVLHWFQEDASGSP
jgi:hypothetical protein